MRKTYFVETSGEELTEKQAENRAVDYFQANGIP